MSYAPAPGSVAYRAFAHLQALPAGTELMTAAWAETVGTSVNNFGPNVEPLLKHGLVQRRQKWPGPRAPFFWSIPSGALAINGADCRSTQVPDSASVGSGQVPHSSPPVAAASDEAYDVPQFLPLVATPEHDDGPSHAQKRAPWPYQAEPLVPAPAAPCKRTATKAPPKERSQPTEPAKSLNIALWSNGELEIRSGGGCVVLLTEDETRQLVKYLMRAAVESA